LGQKRQDSFLVSDCCVLLDTTILPSVDILWVLETDGTGPLSVPSLFLFVGFSSPSFQMANLVPVPAAPLPSLADVMHAHSAVPVSGLYAEFTGLTFQQLIDRGATLYLVHNVGPRAEAAATAIFAADPLRRIDLAAVVASSVKVRCQGLLSVLSEMSAALVPETYQPADEYSTGRHRGAVRYPFGQCGGVVAFIPQAALAVLR
jgi:hypothetical protein